MQTLSGAKWSYVNRGVSDHGAVGLRDLDREPRLGDLVVAKVVSVKTRRPSSFSTDHASGHDRGHGGGGGYGPGHLWSVASGPCPVANVNELPASAPVPAAA
jgi:hypothetical protein